MPFADVNGISVNYQLYGSGPVLVFAHGSGGNSLSWWQQIPEFSKYFTCLTYDQRSFGLTADDSEKPKGRSEFANDLKALLDYLVIDMPPGTGDVQMGLAKMLPRSDMIVVTTS